jgi:hypothetical protein
MSSPSNAGTVLMESQLALTAMATPQTGLGSTVNEVLFRLSMVTVLAKIASLILVARFWRDW